MTENEALESDIIDPLAEVEELPSVKDRMVESLGKDARVDLFLYSVRESYDTLKATDKLPEEGHAPTLGESNGDLSSALAKLLEWYKSEYEFMATGKPMDYNRLGEVVEPAAYLYHDMLVLFAKLNLTIPKWSDSPESRSFWSQIQQALQSGFGKCGEWYEKFLQWTFREQQEESVAPGSRPPIGRFAPRFPRSDRGGGDRGGPRGGGGGRGGDRGGRGDRGGGPRGGDRGGPRGGGRGDRGGGPRGGGSRSDRGGRGRDGDRGGRPNREDRDQRSAKLEEFALKDVAKAIRTLKDDGNLAGVTLKPTNSFYRRMQHQQAADAGFGSESVGEGHDRAVRLIRK